MVASALEGAPAVLQQSQPRAQNAQLLLGHLVRPVEQLVGVNTQVVIGDMSCSEFAVEKIVGGIDSTQARVCVVVGIHAHAERTIRP